jgi:hypothetical protein
VGPSEALWFRLEWLVTDSDTRIRVAANEFRPESQSPLNPMVPERTRQCASGQQDMLRDQKWSVRVRGDGGSLKHSYIYAHQVTYADN